MSKLKGDMKFYLPVGLPWLTSNQDPSKLMSRGEFITTLMAQRFEDADEIYVGSDAAEVEKILEVLDNYQIGRHGKEGSIVVTEHVSPKRGLAGHELGCLVMVNSMPNMQLAINWENLHKGNCHPDLQFLVGNKLADDTSKPARTLRFYEDLCSAALTVLPDGVQGYPVIELLLLRACNTGEHSDIPGTPELCYTEALQSFGFDAADLEAFGWKNASVLEIFKAMRAFMTRELVKGNNEHLLKARRAVENKDTTLLITALKDLQPIVSWSCSAERAGVYDSHVMPLSAAFCSRIFKIAEAAPLAAVLVQRHMKESRFGNKAYLTFNVRQSFISGFNQAGIYGGRCLPEVGSAAAAASRKGQKLNPEQAVAATARLQAANDRTSLAALQRNLAICVDQFFAYGTSNYLLWGLTREELDEGKTHLEKAQRVSRDPVLHKFMIALGNTRNDLLKTQANEQFELDYPARGFATRALTASNASSSASKKRKNGGDDDKMKQPSIASFLGKK